MYPIHWISIGREGLDRGYYKSVKGNISRVIIIVSTIVIVFSPAPLFLLLLSFLYINCMW